MTQDLEAIKSPQEYLPEDQMKAVSFDLVEAQQKAIELKVTSEVTMESANAVCGKIRARQKGIENFRLAIVAPFKQHIAKIDKFFKDLQGQFDEPLEKLEKKVLAYRETRKVAPAKTSFQEGVGRTTFIRRAEYEIVNADLVPDEFWCLDEKKIGSRAREMASDKSIPIGAVSLTTIPGVKITIVERPSYAGEK